MKQMHTSSRVFILLLIICSIIFTCVVKMIEDDAEERYSSSYARLQASSIMYTSSLELAENVFEVVPLLYFDMAANEVEDGNVFDIRTCFENGEQLSDEQVEMITYVLDSMRTGNQVYQSLDYLMVPADSQNEGTKSSSVFGNSDLSVFATPINEPSTKKSEEALELAQNDWYMSFRIDEHSNVKTIRTNSAYSAENLYEQQRTNFEEELKVSTKIDLKLKRYTFSSIVLKISNNKLYNDIYINDVSPNNYILSIEQRIKAPLAVFYPFYMLLMLLLGFLLPLKQMRDIKVIDKSLSKTGFWISLAWTIGLCFGAYFIIPPMITNTSLVFYFPLYTILFAIFILPSIILGLHIRQFRIRHKSKKKTAIDTQDIDIHENIIEKEDDKTFLYEVIASIYKMLERICFYLIHMKLTGSDHRRLMMIVLINTALILLFVKFVSTFGANLYPLKFIIIWGGYSFFIFLILSRYMKNLRRDYEQLDIVIKRAANAPDGEIKEDLGIFNPMKDSLQHLQDDFHTAVEQEVHSQKMKSELITNVSHDLKTPLTSIISYIDLMKDETLQNEERMKYIEILNINADRLKHLIENLFEISKANSGNVSLDYMNVDLVSLIKQVETECDAWLMKHQLTLRNHFQEEKIVIPLDSQKTYRIFENLFSNVGKYALANTRVYVNVEDYGNMVEVQIKNISASELNFRPEDIMERFTRGDESRNTEGSGLGLAIAKSFSELQNGTMNIHIDGDLFAVIIRFYRKSEDESKE